MPAHPVAARAADHDHEGASVPRGDGANDARGLGRAAATSGEDLASREFPTGATVRASDSATVEASGSATVEASGSATVRASGSATVRASGSAVIHRPDSACSCCTPKVTVAERAVYVDQGGPGAPVIVTAPKEG